MYRQIRKLSHSTLEEYRGRHRFEHWYVDNQVYFITSTCRDHFRALASERAKLIFWDRFEHYCNEYGFVPWVTSLLDNHYHTLGYIREGRNIGKLMQRLHGSVAKLVNDILPERRENFWRDARGKEYFDGCIRDEKQGRLAYRYTLMQARRHRIIHDYTIYPHTHVNIPVDVAIKRALELQAFFVGCSL